MITIGFSTRKINNSFIEMLNNSSGLKNLEVIPFENQGEYSLSEVYNKILDQSSNDIVILCHDDIYFEKDYWGKRIIDHFEKKENYGILGVAGTKYYPKSGMWWEISSEMIGQVYHQHEGKKWISQYNEPFGNKIIETIIVDGLFIAIHKKRINKKFNENVSGFHFYDTTFCFENFLSGVKIGTVSNIPLTHLSIGMTNQKWEENRIKFSETFKNDLPQILKTELPVFELKKNQPIVSIIMPIYNYGKMFQKSLESVFNSTYKNIELVIVNDGSTDDYVIKKLDTLTDHPNIKIINQTNLGPANARNVGIKNSIGEYILPLDSDDMISPDYIQTCLNVIKKDKTISPVYCDTNHVGEINGVEVRPEWSKERLIQGPFIVNCSMFSREAYNTTNGYDETMNGWEDYDLWVQMMVNGYVGKRISKPMFIYFHHENDGTVSTEANKNHQALYEYIINKNKIFEQ